MQRTLRRSTDAATTFVLPHRSMQLLASAEGTTKLQQRELASVDEVTIKPMLLIWFGPFQKKSQTARERTQGPLKMAK